MTDYDIEDDIPIPTMRGNEKYPLGRMEVGQSFFDPEKKQSAMSAVTSTYGRRHNLKFTVRSVEENGVLGVRVSASGMKEPEGTKVAHFKGASYVKCFAQWHKFHSERLVNGDGGKPPVVLRTEMHRTGSSYEIKIIYKEMEP